MRMKSSLTQTVLFIILFAASHFVNKFVLSVLGFQYPTIFQGWQTLIGFLMISLLVTTKHLPALMENVTRGDIAQWLPGMACFVCMIYSGSKALAKLSIPTYLSLHNLVTVILCTSQLVIYRQLTSIFSYSMIMVLVISSIVIGITDPDYDRDAYFWMCLHILSTGALGIFSKLIKARLKLSSNEKLYCNYLYSMIVLAPSSYFLGDAVEAGKYPYLYFSKFYMGCIMSGVFGVLLSLCAIQMLETNGDKAEFSRIQGLAKLITSATSLLFFDMSITANNSMWLLVNHLCAIACEDSTGIEETPVLPFDSSEEYQRRPNSLTKDYIRTPQ